MPQGEKSVAFTDLGGPFRKGLIAASGPGESSPLRVVGRYDLDNSGETTLSADAVAASRLDIPEAACLEPWHDTPTAGERLFFAAMSPIALFCACLPTTTRQERSHQFFATPPLPGLPQLA